MQGRLDARVKSASTLTGDEAGAELVVPPAQGSPGLPVATNRLTRILQRCRGGSGVQKSPVARELGRRRLLTCGGAEVLRGGLLIGFRAAEVRASSGRQRG